MFGLHRPPEVQAPRLPLEELLAPYGMFEQLPARWPTAGSQDAPIASAESNYDLPLDPERVVEFLDRLKPDEAVPISSGGRRRRRARP
jgi:hypothetical protein